MLFWAAPSTGRSDKVEEPLRIPNQAQDLGDEEDGTAEDDDEDYVPHGPRSI